MPKRPTNRRVDTQGRFRRRLAQEQERAGLSDNALAARLAEPDIDYPVSGAALWRVKNAEPPRAVNLDEGEAIAAAFGYDGVADFLAGRGIPAGVRQAAGMNGRRFATATGMARESAGALAVAMGANPADPPGAGSERWEVLLGRLHALDPDDRRELAEVMTEHGDAVAFEAAAFAGAVDEYLTRVRWIIDAVEQGDDA